MCHKCLAVAAGGVFVAAVVVAARIDAVAVAAVLAAQGDVVVVDAVEAATALAVVAVVAPVSRVGWPPLA